MEIKIWMAWEIKVKSAKIIWRIDRTTSFRIHVIQEWKQPRSLFIMQIRNRLSNPKSVRVSICLSKNNDGIRWRKKNTQHEIIRSTDLIWKFRKGMVVKNKKNLKNERRVNAWVGIRSWK